MGSPALATAVDLLTEIERPRVPCRVEQRDALELLASLAPGSVDLMVTDPPYSSLEKHRAVGTTTRLTKQWFPVVENDYFRPFFELTYRALAKNAHAYLFCDQETMFAIKPMGEAAGFKFWKPIVWDKVAIGMGYHFRARYELILFFEKGKRKLSDLGVADVITHKRIANAQYPTEKPPEVSEVLIRQSSVAGELVLDPFCGSGSVGVAAARNGRRFLGGDVVEGACGLARLRTADAGGTDDALEVERCARWKEAMG